MALLIVFWILTQFAGMFAPPLMDDVDALHAEAAREMLVRHEFSTLYVDGIRYLEKPPLPYWSAALSMAVFGQHDWAVRLVLVLASLVLTLYIYVLGRRLFGERAGFYAGAAMATCVGPYIYTRFFIPDIIIALWMTAAFDLSLRLIEAVKQRGEANCSLVALFALVCTGAVLTKGLIGVVFPCALLFGYLLISRRLTLLRKMRPIFGTAVFLITAAPWHVWIALKNQASGASRGFLWFYFINDQLYRYLNKRIPRDYDKVPLVLFYGLLFVWILPWGVFLFRGAFRWIKEWRANRRSLDTAPVLLAWWVVLIVGFFTLSTRQEYYSIPAVPALALLAGLTLSCRDSEKGTGRAAYVALFASGALMAIICLVLAAVSKTPPPGAQLWEALSRHPEDYALSFGHLFDFTTTAFGFFQLPLLAMALSLFLPTALALWFKTRDRAFAANLALAFGMCAVLGSVHMGLSTFYPILGSKPLADAVARTLRPDDRIVIDGEYSNASTINFYTQHPVEMLNGRVNNLWYGSLYPDAPQRFYDDASFTAVWSSPTRVFFVAHSLAAAQHRLTPGAVLVGASGGKFIILNHQ